MHITRRAARRAVCENLSASPASVWISDELLQDTFLRYLSLRDQHHRRFYHHVPGPLEARRRLAKRRMTDLATNVLPTSDVPPLTHAPTSLLDFRWLKQAFEPPPQTQVFWEAPSHTHAAHEAFDSEAPGLSWHENSDNGLTRNATVPSLLDEYPPPISRSEFKVLVEATPSTLENLQYLWETTCIVETDLAGSSQDIFMALLQAKRPFFEVASFLASPYLNIDPISNFELSLKYIAAEHDSLDTVISHLRSLETAREIGLVASEGASRLAQSAASHIVELASTAEESTLDFTAFTSFLQELECSGMLVGLASVLLEQPRLLCNRHGGLELLQKLLRLKLANPSESTFSDIDVQAIIQGMIVCLEESQNLQSRDLFALLPDTLLNLTIRKAIFSLSSTNIGSTRSRRLAVNLTNASDTLRSYDRIFPQGLVDDFYKSVSKQVTPSEIANHFLTLGSTRAVHILRKYWMREALTRRTILSSSLYRAERLKKFNIRASGIGNYAVLIEDLKYSSSKISGARLDASLESIFRLFLSMNKRDDFWILAMYASKMLRQRIPMGPLRDFILKYHTTSPRQATEIFLLRGKMWLSTCPELILKCIESPSVQHQWIWPIIERPDPDTRLPVTNRPHHPNCAISDARIQLMHSIAMAFATSTLFDHRQAFRETRRCLKYLKDRHAPIFPEMVQALMIACVERPRAAGEAINIENLRSVCDVIAKLEGIEAADQVFDKYTVLSYPAGVEKSKPLPQRTVGRLDAKKRSALKDLVRLGTSITRSAPSV